MKFLRIVPLALVLFCPLSNFAQNIPFVADTVSGCDTLRVTFRFLNLPGTDTISTLDWDFGNGQTASGKADHEVLYDTNGFYDISITINNNTTLTRNDYISVFPTPDPFFIYRDFSDSMVVGTYTYLFRNIEQADNTLEYQYLWNMGTDDQPVTRSVIHTFPEAGSYPVELQVSHNMGCTASMARIIEVRDTLILPNVFSPNDDNINDYFKVVTNGLTTFSIKIFSRSGILVYEAQSPTIIWDGRNMSGQELPPDTYYIIIKPMNSSSVFKSTGFVRLFR
jgi:gliding motility-associated-like protein